MMIVRFVLYFVVLLSSGMCCGYLQLAFHPDCGRRPMWSLAKDRNRTFMMIVLSINTLMFVPALIWGITETNWSIARAIITAFICGSIGIFIEIILEDVNRQFLLMIPFFSTSVLCILLWVL